jgi:ABC-type multidrug transport system ATPase subunit
MVQPIIDVQQLTKTFNEVTAVSDLNFQVFQGDVYGFLGQNGAGKSTSIRMLLSLIHPTSGTINIFGKPLHMHRQQVLQRMGAVIEKPDMYKYLTGNDNINLFAKLCGKKITTKEINDTLELTGIRYAAHRKIKTYSQGMKQRLGIAIALVHNPDIIILDEPTNGLDPQGIVDIRNLIKHLSADLKKTVIVSTHLLAEIEQVATRILIIDKGKKVVEGSAAELLNPNQTQLEIETTNAAVLMQLLATSAWGNNGNMVQFNNSIKLTLKKDDIPALNNYLVANQIPIYKITPRNHLENYFLNLTNATTV